MFCCDIRRWKRLPQPICNKGEHLIELITNVMMCSGKQKQEKTQMFSFTQVRGGNEKAQELEKGLGMSLVENIFEDYFLYEVPHVNKRHVKNLIFRQIIRSEDSYIC